MELAREHDVEMPIAAEVYAVTHQGRPVEAFRGLLRHAGHEVTRSWSPPTDPCPPPTPPQTNEEAWAIAHMWGAASAR